MKELLRKKGTDLTVGESLKLSGIVCVATLAMYAAFYGGYVVIDNLKTKRELKKMQKEKEVMTEEE